EIGVNLSPIGKVEGDGSIDLLKRQSRKLIDNGLWRGSIQEEKDDRFQGYPRTHQVVTTVSIFNIFPCHIPSPFLTYDNSMPPADRTNSLSLGRAPSPLPRIPNPLSLIPCPLSLIPCPAPAL